MALVDSEAAFASHRNTIDGSRELLNLCTAANLPVSWGWLLQLGRLRRRPVKNFSESLQQK